MNANFGLVHDLPEPVRDTLVRRERLARRATAGFRAWRDDVLGAAPVASAGIPAGAAA